MPTLSNELVVRQRDYLSKRDRIVAIITMDDTDWTAAYGDNADIARMVGCSPQYVASVRSKVRRGWRPRGRAIKAQPHAITGRLLDLDRRVPGLSRGEQALLLGTSYGMVKDTVYRLRRDGFTVSDPRRGP